MWFFSWPELRENIMLSDACTPPPSEAIGIFLGFLTYIWPADMSSLMLVTSANAVSTPDHLSCSRSVVLWSQFQSWFCCWESISNILSGIGGFLASRTAEI